MNSTNTRHRAAVLPGNLLAIRTWIIQNLLNLAVVGGAGAIFATFWASGAFTNDNERAACANAWARSGLKSEWQKFGGCLVQLRDGTWVPESAVKVSP